MTRKWRDWLTTLQFDPKLQEDFLKSSEALVGNIDVLNPIGSNNRDEIIGIPALTGDRMWKPLKWKLPTYSILRFDYKNSNEINKYLNKQERRIKRALENGDKVRALSIWVTLMTRSNSYLLLHLNKSLRGWYFNLSMGKLNRAIVGFRRAAARLDVNALYRRVYIPKGEGKWRPLGVPNHDWRILLSMISEILYLTIEKDIGDYQMGFRPNRNVWDAWDVILKKVKKGYYLYEFDLEACFNRISLHKTLDILTMKLNWLPMLNYMSGILSQIPMFTKSELKEENEIETQRVLYIDLRENDADLLGFGGFYKDVILKFGLPQGFSLSPLLAINVIDSGIKKVGWDCIMYADDGIIFKKRKSEFKELSTDWKTLEAYGMYPSLGNKKDGRPKTGPISDEINFLGVKYSISRNSWWIEDQWRLNTPDNYKWLKSQYQGGVDDYSKKESKWKWNIIKHSWLWHTIPIISWINLAYFFLWLCGKKDIKRFGWRFVSIPVQSSFAINELADKLRKMNKSVMRRRKFVRKFDGFPSSYKYNYESDFVEYNRNETRDFKRHRILRILSVDNWEFQSDLDLRFYAAQIKHDCEILFIDPAS